MNDIKIKDIKYLVKLFRVLIVPLNISDFELYCNYNENLQGLYHRDITNEEFEKELQKDILNDFVYNFEYIKTDIKNAIDNWSEDSLEYKNIKKMVEEIKKVFKDFDLEV